MSTTSLRLAALLTILGGAVTLTAGCPAGACFLEICQGSNCRCSISSCQEGAGYDTKQDRCRCLKGFFDVAGQCLNQWQANAFCGAGFAWVGTPGGAGGCQKLSCKSGDKLDEKTGWCIPKEQVAQQAGVTLNPNETVGCPAGQVLIVDGGSSACVPVAQTCAKDETWNGTACQKVGACPTGQIFDPALSRCVPYADGGEGGVSVDAQQWAFSTYGPPNGGGTPAFCSSFAKKPLSFGLKPGSSAFVRVTVQLSFPGGEIAKGQAQSVTVYDVSGNPVPPSGAAEVQSAVLSSFQTLVAGGGKAKQPTAQTTVKCSVINASAPVVVPETGGV